MMGVFEMIEPIRYDIERIAQWLSENNHSCGIVYCQGGFHASVDRLELDWHDHIAKLPRYADTGEPFVPHVDPCWVWDAATDTPFRSDPVCLGYQWRPSPKWVSLRREGNFYSTRESCEEANR